MSAIVGRLNVSFATYMPGFLYINCPVCVHKSQQLHPRSFPKFPGPQVPPLAPVPLSRPKSIESPRIAFI
jgi:hypothetical protein